MMTSLRLGLCLVPLALALVSCTRDHAGTPIPSEAGSATGLSHDERIRYLKELGFDTENIVSVPDGYMLEGDIHIPLAYFPDRPAPLAKKSQRRSQNLVDQAAANKIKVRIHASLRAWTNEALAAVNLLNDIQSGVYLNMVDSNAAADITIAADTWYNLPTTLKRLSDRTCGMAGLPLSSGIPYQFVSINMDIPVLVSNPVQRTMTIAHELGHTLGLRHTHGDNHGSGELIPGTPYTDPYSIMRGETCGDHAPGPSEGDAQALRILYPKDIPLGGTRLIDSDSHHDLVVWRPSDGNWYSLLSSGNFASWSIWNHGFNQEFPMSASQYDAGEGDLVVYRPFSGTFRIRTSGSSYGTETEKYLGGVGYRSVPATDLDHDGMTDPVVWNWVDGMWYFITSSSGYSTYRSFQWGLPGDIPVPDTDLDGDGRDDIVVWRPSTGYWHARTAASDFSVGISRLHGKLGDTPLPSMDIDGDNRQDMVVWRPSNGTWRILTYISAYGTQLVHQWGARGDIPLSKTDVDKDWKADLVVWRRDNGTWYTRTQASNFTAGNPYQWGL